MTDIRMNATSRSRSARTVAVDNFLRKTLRVGDPRNPDEIAKALLDRYPREADRVRRESEGYAHSSQFILPTPPQIGLASVAELTQAQDDLERDLQSLTGASQLKDIRVELTGWGRSVRQTATDGLAAARLALDSVNYNRALTARRALGEYARLARYVGALNDSSGSYFRRFAQSCDVMAGLILVGIGESLAASGITPGAAMVRISAGDLQMRRNAVITALRGLTGTLEGAADQEQYPRGMSAYLELTARLEEDGQADLSALLEENTVGQAMDDLVDLSTGASVEGLRELSTASALLVQRFQRLIGYARSIDPNSDGVAFAKSPPLATFITSLELFVDAFASNGSTRLLYVSRPPITAYGLYGSGAADAAATRLRELASVRGLIASQVDCFGGCGCDPKRAKCQILLDYLLYGIDRAIDLYAVGTDPNGKGDPEARAAIGGLLIDLVVARFADEDDILCPIDESLRRSLHQARDILAADFAQADLKRFAIAEVQIAHPAEERLERLVRTLAPGCSGADAFTSGDMFGFDDQSPVRALLKGLLRRFDTELSMSRTADLPETWTASGVRIARSLGQAQRGDCEDTDDGRHYVGGPREERPGASQGTLRGGPNAVAVLGAAFDPRGEADSRHPLGRAFIAAGFPTLRSLTEGGPANVRQGRFVAALLRELAAAESELGRTLVRADLVQIYKLAPTVIRAIDERDED